MPFKIVYGLFKLMQAIADESLLGDSRVYIYHGCNQIEQIHIISVSLERVSGLLLHSKCVDAVVQHELWPCVVYIIKISFLHSCNFQEQLL